jgi:hypothetical protein
MNTVKTAIFFCTLLLAVGALAWQYPSGSQPAQQPQQQPSPSQPSQTQPSGQQGAQPGQAPSIDDQVQILAVQLNLTPDQQAKVKTVLEDQHTQAMAVVHDNSLAREDKIQKIHAIRENTIAKVRDTLTSDDQKQKFEQMLQGQDQRMHQQQPSQPSQPAQPAPTPKP